MPTRLFSVTTTEERKVLNADNTRIVAVIQNIGTEYVYLSDVEDRALAHAAIKLAPGGVLELRIVFGDNPHKDWYGASENADVDLIVYENNAQAAAPGSGSQSSGAGSNAASLLLAFGAGGLVG